MSGTSNGQSVLVVDDATHTLRIVERILSAAGYRVFTASSAEAARTVIESTPVDLVVTDLRMPGGDGLDLVRHIRENERDIEVMMITGYASIEGAVEAIRAGAQEYLSKPFTEEELLSSVRNALSRLQMRRAANDLGRSSSGAPAGLVGESVAMKRLSSMIRKASATDATVLISGESGTGKEMVARSIHYGSARASSAFVPVNCGAIPEGLMESELFGHVKGAFTGAAGTRAGFFQTAHGGTIFLDEIGEMSPAMQVKLLRALQDREIRMVGSSNSRFVDARVIAATNKDLGALVAGRAFREDLFYRLNVVPIEVPPLRDRDADVLLLARHFADRFTAMHSRSALRFTDAVLDALRAYSWPGNVRELENLVQRLVVVADSPTIDMVDLPPHMRPSHLHARRFNRTLADVEAEHVLNVLQSVGGNKSRAAAILGICRKTLRDKLGQDARPGAKPAPARR